MREVFRQNQVQNLELLIKDHCKNVCVCVDSFAKQDDSLERVKTLMQEPIFSSG